MHNEMNIKNENIIITCSSPAIKQINRFDSSARDCRGKHIKSSGLSADVFPERKQNDHGNKYYCDLWRNAFSLQAIRSDFCLHSSPILDATS